MEGLEIMNQQTTEEKFDKELMKIYKKSKNNNFMVVDTIGVPHPFCITPKHVRYASDNFSGMLGKDAIERMEKESYDSGCGTCHGSLSFAQHETALLVQCLKEPKDNNKYGKELQTYLKKVIKIAHFKSKGFAGVTLMDSFGGKKSKS